ncbi:MAG: outer membrane beta-barrel protein [Bacteroidales bacterium]|nr:outer membrane beta-barrel protein [Bacteroidales bacterium]
MEKLKYSKEFLLLLFITTILSQFVNAQNDVRISVQIAPILSYQITDYGDYSSRYNNESETPQFGIRSQVRFEFDMDKYLSLNIGFSYEIRKNSLSTGMLYDTSEATLPLLDMPYRVNSERTYKFFGIPIAFSVNYFNNSKIRIYQTFGLQLSFLLSAEYDSEGFYEYDYIRKESGNYNEYKADYIVSGFSSIGISRRLNEKLAINLEPGFIYMINEYMEMPYSRKKERFLDLKVDLGLTYNF